MIGVSVLEKGTTNGGNFRRMNFVCLLIRNSELLRIKNKRKATYKSRKTARSNLKILSRPHLTDYCNLYITNSLHLSLPAILLPSILLSTKKPENMFALRHLFTHYYVILIFQIDDGRQMVTVTAVSYTHLDVYKRQHWWCRWSDCHLPLFQTGS